MICEPRGIPSPHYVDQVRVLVFGGACSRHQVGQPLLSVAVVLGPFPGVVNVQLHDLIREHDLGGGHFFWNDWSLTMALGRRVLL